jgi:hypothetical protein
MYEIIIANNKHLQILQAYVVVYSLDNHFGGMFQSWE